MRQFAFLNNHWVIQQVEDVIGWDHDGDAGVQRDLPLQPRPRPISNLQHGSEDLFMPM